MAKKPVHLGTLGLKASIRHIILSTVEGGAVFTSRFHFKTRIALNSRLVLRLLVSNRNG